MNSKPKLRDYLTIQIAIADNNLNKAIEEDKNELEVNLLKHHLDVLKEIDTICKERNKY